MSSRLYRFRINGEDQWRHCTPINARRLQRRLEGGSSGEVIRLDWPDEPDEPEPEPIPYPCADPLCEGEVAEDGEVCGLKHSVGVDLRVERLSAMRRRLADCPAFGRGLYGPEGFDRYRRRILDEARELYRLASGIGVRK